MTNHTKSTEFSPEVRPCNGDAQQGHRAYRSPRPCSRREEELAHSAADVVLVIAGDEKDVRKARKGIVDEAQNAAPLVDAVLVGPLRIEAAGVAEVARDHQFAIDFGRRLVGSQFVASLPHAADQELIGHAIALGCDTFCTCDRKSIIRKRDRLKLPIRIITPVEGWAHSKPWAGLWS